MPPKIWSSASSKTTQIHVCTCRDIINIYLQWTSSLLSILYCEYIQILQFFTHVLPAWAIHVCKWKRKNLLCACNLECMYLWTWNLVSKTCTHVHAYMYLFYEELYCSYMKYQIMILVNVQSASLLEFEHTAEPLLKSVET